MVKAVMNGRADEVLDLAVTNLWRQAVAKGKPAHGERLRLSNSRSSSKTFDNP
jgi:hypothetical protein